ncbi:L-lactate dehydrogenase, Iron-sulfur cluster-binding subunit YkgF [Dissulfuribacter thermophilus]|uniref:Glycolate oxidase iron-sulfur subunit n=1 Tax=Dissulfuribacter thermophilus TaxID=1156395 RepID=A0A1B9F5X9_9BACT|nr:(Fe-S)-binding protein [Dissulfuribacter thermophilus]OCC15347.1 L-lactate dehydrogenase, Iron-sulfur cluster-binding subunit YkgF [Dissulfuribacter thermophilus]
MNKCSRCGKCHSFCPVYSVALNERLSPRGKYHLISACTSALSSEEETLETIGACLQCGACESLCPSEAEVGRLVREIRSTTESHGNWDEIIKFVVSRPGLSDFFIKRISKLPIGSGLASRIIKMTPWGTPSFPKRSFVETVKRKRVPKLRSGDKRISFFVGCVQNYLLPHIPEQGLSFLGNKVRVPEAQVCCGLPAWSAGWKDAFRSLVKRNLDCLLERDTGAIITLCSSCAYTIKKIWPLAFSEGSSEFERAKAAAEMLIDVGEFLVGIGSHRMTNKVSKGLKVAIHSPCHERFLGSNKSEGIEHLLKDYGHEVMARISVCCGHGGTFSMKFSQWSQEIFKRAMSEFESSGADLLVTTCSGCMLQWRMGMESMYGKKANRVARHVIEIL